MLELCNTSVLSLKLIVLLETADCQLALHFKYFTPKMTADVTGLQLMCANMVSGYLARTDLTN